MIGLFSFFSGAGFLDLGFEKTGKYEVMFVNEYKPSFNRIYKHAHENMGVSEPVFGHHVGDVSEWLEDDCKYGQLCGYMQEAVSHGADLVGFIGGPPCPDFSVAGKNRGKEGENGKLSQTYADLICKSQPDFFVFENVKGLYTTEMHRQFYEALKYQFRLFGYALTEHLVNSIEFGVPQDRYRIILVGVKKDTLARLGRSFGENDVINGFDWDRHKLYDRNVLKGTWPKTTPYKEDVRTEVPEGIVKELTVQYWWDRNNVAEHPNQTMYFQPRAGLDKFKTKDEGDMAKKCYKRLHRWKYSPTAAYGNNEVHIHPYKPRRISVAEALAIQSLPPEYVIPGDVTLTDAFKTIGNGVPFLLAKGIALTLFDFINGDVAE
jgi:DNA (cytosine-5)-methyltransferase 1